MCGRDAGGRPCVRCRAPRRGPALQSIAHEEAQHAALAWLDDASLHAAGRLPVAEANALHQALLQQVIAPCWQALRAG